MASRALTVQVSPRCKNQAAGVPSSEKETQDHGHTLAARAHLHQESGMQPVSTSCMIKSGLRKVSVEDIERLAASATTMRRRPGSQDTTPPSQV